MLFTWDITIPVNTLESEPIIQTLRLSAGILTHLAVKFPAGCHGWVKVRLFLSENQILPIPRGEWVTGDDEAAESDYYIDLSKRPQELEFEGCSPGSLFDHVVTVRITMLPKEVATVLPLIETITRFLRKLGLG